MSGGMDIIKKAQLEKYVVPGKRYHSPLPPELEPFYCYTSDGGHSIIVVLENVYEEGEPVEGYLVPAPVKTVLRAGWKIRDGYAWSAIAYDSETGLEVEENDTEY